MDWISDNMYHIYGGVVAVLLITSFILYLFGKKKSAKVLYVIGIVLFSLLILFGITLIIVFLLSM